MADVARFVRSKGSTVGGARAEFEQKMKVGGIDIADVPEDQYTALKGGYNVSIDDFVQWQQGEVNYGKEWDYSDGSSSADLRGGFGGGL